MYKILLIALGGAIGSVLRYALGHGIKTVTNTVFPWSTLFINIIGSLLIGILAAVYAKHHQQYNWVEAFGIIGLCGGFTTFSTFSLENIKLMQQGAYLQAFTYIALSIIVCLGSTLLGHWLVLKN
jgi:CrcB protein